MTGHFLQVVCGERDKLMFWTRFKYSWVTGGISAQNEEHTGTKSEYIFTSE